MIFVMGFVNDMRFWGSHVHLVGIRCQIYIARFYGKWENDELVPHLICIACLLHVLFRRHTCIKKCNCFQGYCYYYVNMLYRWSWLCYIRLYKISYIPGLYIKEKFLNDPHNFSWRRGMSLLISIWQISKWEVIRKTLYRHWHYLQT